jgi:hypothetical protein
VGLLTCEVYMYMKVCDNLEGLKKVCVCVCGFEYVSVYVNMCVFTT